MPKPVKKKGVRSTTPKTKRLDQMMLLLYGQSGSGKTSLASQFPKCGFIIDNQEKGIKFLTKRDLVPKPLWIKELDAQSKTAWQKLIDMCFDAAGDNDIETLVLESLTGFENMAFLYHCKKNFNDNWSGEREGGGFFDYAKGPRQTARLEIPRLIEALIAVFESGKSVIVTAHATTKEETDPSGTSLMKYTPYCDKDVWARFHRWASCVFFIGTSAESKQKGLRKVAVGGTKRHIFIEATPFAEAKNWCGLQGVVPGGESGKEAYDNLVEVFNE